MADSDTTNPVAEGTRLWNLGYAARMHDEPLRYPEGLSTNGAADWMDGWWRADTLIKQEENQNG